MQHESRGALLAMALSSTTMTKLLEATSQPAEVLSAFAQRGGSLHLVLRRLCHANAASTKLMSSWPGGRNSELKQFCLLVRLI